MTQKGIDAGIYIPHNKLKITKSNEKLLTLEPSFKAGDSIFAGIQIKKDFSVTLKEYKEILQKWEDTKLKIQVLLATEKVSLNFVLFIFNESFCRETGKINLSLNLSINHDVIVFFMDTKNAHFFYPRN